ncbi:MAG: hypothetical protein K2M87_06165 [Muribaculaceae bacterium]|nr:hypothetical protein [Muribaculaceae bacterium]
MSSSCTKNEPAQPAPVKFDSSEVKRSIILYAVNNSSLAKDFADDYSEITKYISSCSDNSAQFLLYKTDTDSKKSGLYRVARYNDNTVRLDTLIKYDYYGLSTDPERISQVLNDAKRVYPDAKQGLIFWGHGTSWTPEFSDHKHKAYGGGYNSEDGFTVDWTDIDELAEAVPSDTFDFIWFDCCYMASIEVLYQFRDKCDHIVAYPTEVWSSGMNYQRVLPYLMMEKPELTKAAAMFYKVYADYGQPVTVGVFDISKIQSVAELAKDIYNFGNLRPSSSQLLNYSRKSGYPYYDLRQVLTLTAELNGNENRANEINRIMNEFVLYHAESKINFNSQWWDDANISGVSTHLYLNRNTNSEAYYRTLDWYKRVYP